MKTFGCLALTVLAMASPISGASAAGVIRLGLMTELSGPISVSGNEMKRGFDLALDQLGHKLGGVPVQTFVVDDKSNPSVAVQGASQLIDQDKVEIVTGLGASNVLIPTEKRFLDAGVFVLPAFGGAARFAGADCNKNAFFLGFENEDSPTAIGRYMADHGVKTAYFVASDYAAGQEIVKATMDAFKARGGKVVGLNMTPLSQLDFSAEIASIQAAKPDAAFIWEVGPQGIAFAKQYGQAGLTSRIPMYSTDFYDAITLPAVRGAADGIIMGASWSPDLKNAANKAFVTAFEKKYGRKPAAYAAFQYDAIMLLDSAVRAVHGDIANKDAFRAALRKADFHSVRGQFRFNNNQFPIQNVYIEEVSKDAQGKEQLVLKATAAKNWQDKFHNQCPMKW